VKRPYLATWTPTVNTVGPFADADYFAETLCAGIIYGAAVTELLLQQSEVDLAWTTVDDLTDDDLDALIATDDSLESKWRTASLMLGLEA